MGVWQYLGKEKRSLQKNVEYKQIITTKSFIKNVQQLVYEKAVVNLMYTKQALFSLQLVIHVLSMTTK